jgi:hypothetical protein
MSITVTDLVQLPQVGAQAARALGTQVLAAARTHALPKSVTKAHAKLAASHTDLETAIVRQFDAGNLDHPAEAEPAIQELDRIIDNCWAGLDDRLSGLARLPADIAGVVDAASLRRRLFPGGLAFLKLSYKLEWSESQTRLQLIEKEKLGPAIDRLAGKQFLPAIQEAHANYGRALGMAQALPLDAAVPQVRESYDAFIAALRNYVVKVVATVEDDDEDSKALADQLLAPLERWAAAAKRARAASAGQGSTPEAPADPAAPADAATASPAAAPSK